MENQALPILTVKFKIPEPRKNYVVRKDLFRKLKDIDKKKLTIIKAGAGSGKTTLVSSYIKESTFPNLRWISLSDSLNQVFIFWKYILEGTKEYLGESVNDFSSFYDGNIQKDVLWQLLTVYMNRMLQEKSIILVLDDFHVISDPFTLSTIDYFITNMPSNLHLVLLTRNLPELNLGTVSMEDELLMLDEQEIRMSEEESREFLIHTLNTDIDEDKIKAMINNSNGWVGGLQLMAVAAKEQSKSIIASINSSGRIIGDYITNEIYRYLSENERDFLLKTSIMSYFNQRICEHYLPQYDFNEIMSSILSKNLFVISIDEEAKVYRYHSILKDYLNDLIDQKVPLKIQLHMQAADVFNEVGDFEESLCQLFAAEAYEVIMDKLLLMPQNTLTFSYMMKVPLEIIVKNRDFAYQCFFCYYASMDSEACECIYNMIIKHMKDDDTFSAFQHIDMFLRFFNVDWDFKDIKVLAIEQIDNLPLNPVTKAYLLIKESYFLFLTDQYQEALHYLDRAWLIYEKTGNDYIGAFVLSEKAQILEENGELKNALSIYKKLARYLEYIPTLKTSYYIGITGVYIKKLALGKARESLKQAEESMTGYVLNTKSAYLTNLAELSYLSYDVDTAEHIVEELNKEELYQNIFFSSRLMRYSIHCGFHNDYREKFIKDYEDEDALLKSMDMDLLYIKIIYDNKEEEKALQLIDYLITKVRKLQNKLKIVDLDLMKTRFLLPTENSEREVLNTFIEAVSYAYENGIALPFWFEKKTVETVMKNYPGELQISLSPEEIGFVYDIINADKENGLEFTSDREYDLTEREMEVLAEIKNGYSNKKIADHLCISVATVKSHIINIYNKLGVNNRVAAVNKIKDYTED